MVVPYVATVGAGLRRTVQDSGQPTSDLFAARTGYHKLLAAYYANDLYESARMWQAYKATHRLPRSIRSIYNPTRRAVDFYSGQVYPGAWTEDGKPLPDGTPHALQFPSDVLANKAAFVMAALQALAWGNWQAERMAYVRDGAKLGSVFVEIVDDLERMKVYPDIVPLDHLADITVDKTGNVKAYEISYRAIAPETGQAFDYRRVVNRESITEYRDKSTTREDPNPYGFAPGVWVKHRNVGGLFGAPAIDGVIPKIDEVNRLATSIHNYVGLLQGQPVVFWGKSAPSPVGAKAGASEDDDVSASNESIRWLHGTDEKGHVENMMQPVPIEGAGERVDRLLREIEEDLPEVTMDKVIASLPNASGPIIDRVLPGVRTRVFEAQSNYDAGTIKLMQMSVAIGGWRLATGAWGSRSAATRQQAKFDGFDLESYSKGDLDVSLLPRPLVATTEMERLLALETRKAVANLSDDEVRRQLGYAPEAITKMNEELTQQAERTPVGVF